MLERRGARFLTEAVFLAALAAALSVARLNAPEIAAVMVLGWVIVSGFEWAVWRGEPHYGSGLPPHYFVPHVDLPPPRPLEQLPALGSARGRGYPESREEAPTWIAPAELRAAVLANWPVAASAPATEARPIRLPVTPPPRGPEYRRQPASVPLPTSRPARPEPAEPEPVGVRLPPPEPELVEPLLRAGAPGRVSVYRFDPLAERPAKRLFRRTAEIVDAIEVPVRPSGIRPLPGSAPRRG